MATKTNRKHSWQYNGCTVSPSVHTGAGAWVCFPDGTSGDYPICLSADTKEHMRSQIDAHQRRRARQAQTPAQLPAALVAGAAASAAAARHAALVEANRLSREAGLLSTVCPRAGAGEAAREVLRAQGFAAGADEVTKNELYEHVRRQLFTRGAETLELVVRRHTETPTGSTLTTITVSIVEMFSTGHMPTH